MGEDRDLRAEKRLEKPVTGIVPSEHQGADGILRAYEQMSFQARTLGQAAEIFTRMVKDQGTLKVLTLAGALIPGGLRQVIMEMIRHRLVDIIISTGANVSHDFVEGTGGQHWQRCNFKHDQDLRDAFVNRVHDTFINDEDFERAADVLDAELLTWGGRWCPSSTICTFLGAIATHPCFLKTAFEAKVPVFVPALNDSELGINLNAWNLKHPGQEVRHDSLRDNEEFALRIKASKQHGLLICGGGVPRNWAQQVTPLLESMHVPRGTYVRPFPGYRYGIHITTDTPAYGGLSGCTMSESISWGKYHPKAETVTVNCDVTIALPLIVAATLARIRG